MSELRFDREAETLRVAVGVIQCLIQNGETSAECGRRNIDAAIESALREAAAKALEWACENLEAEDDGAFLMVKALDAIKALRTPSAPNAPR